MPVKIGVKEPISKSLEDLGKKNKQNVCHLETTEDTHNE
jgi:hypothetical protein